MSGSFVQSTSWGAATSGVGPFTSSALTTTAGNQLLFVVFDNAGHFGTITVGDSKSNTYTLLGSYTATSTGVLISVYGCLSPTMGSGHTFNMKGTGNDLPSAIVYEVSGCTMTLDVAVVGATAGSFSTGATVGTLTSSTAGDFVAAFWNFEGSQSSTTAGSGWTASTGRLSNGTSYVVSSQYINNASTGAHANAMTWASSDEPGALIIALVPSATASPMAATVYENLFDVEGDFFEADDHMDEAVFTMLIDTPRPPDTVMAATVVEIPQAFEYDDPDFEEPDGVFFFAQGPPLPDDTGQTTVYYPDDPLDIEDDEAFGFEFFIVGTEAVQDPGGETIVYCPDDTLEPEDEDFGFPDLQIPSDDTGQTTAVFPDAEEPEDEDYGFSDLQVPPNFTPPDTGGEYVCLFPDQEDDLDDEDYGFADLQLPPDTQMSASLAQLDGQEADDPDDESYGHVDFQPPSDDTGELVCSYPDQAEEPEDEDYGFSDMQVPPNASVVETGGEYVCYFEDEAEEPEDEDFGFTAFTIPADTLMAASLVALDDQTPDEPDGEDFGFSDLQVPPNGTVITTRGNVVKGGIWQ